MAQSATTTVRKKNKSKVVLPLLLSVVLVVLAVWCEVGGSVFQVYVSSMQGNDATCAGKSAGDARATPCLTLARAFSLFVAGDNVVMWTDTTTATVTSTLAPPTGVAITSVSMYGNTSSSDSILMCTQTSGYCLSTGVNSALTSFAISNIQIALSPSGGLWIRAPALGSLNLANVQFFQPNGAGNLQKPAIKFNAGTTGFSGSVVFNNVNFDHIKMNDAAVLIEADFHFYTVTMNTLTFDTCEYYCTNLGFCRQNGVFVSIANGAASTWSQLTVNDNIISNSSVINGDWTLFGGFFYQTCNESSSNIVFTDSTFHNNNFGSSSNSALWGVEGGLFYVSREQVSFTKCKFLNNTVYSTNYCYGGALWISPSGPATKFTGCQFQYNTYTSPQVQATIQLYGDASFNNTAIANNIVTGTSRLQGGGIFFYGNGTLTFTNGAIVVCNIVYGLPGVTIIQGGGIFLNTGSAPVDVTADVRLDNNAVYSSRTITGTYAGGAIQPYNANFVGTLGSRLGNTVCCQADSASITSCPACSPAFPGNCIPTPSASPSASRSFSSSRTPSPSLTPSPSPSPSPSRTSSRSPSPSPSRTSTSSPSLTSSPSPTPSATPSVTPSQSVSLSPTSSLSPTPSITPSPSQTPSPSASASSSLSGSPTATLSPSQTSSRSPSPTASPSASPSRARSASSSRSPTASSSSSASASPSAHPSASPSPSGSPDYGSYTQIVTYNSSLPFVQILVTKHPSSNTSDFTNQSSSATPTPFSPLPKGPLRTFRTRDRTNDDTDSSALSSHFDLTETTTLTLSQVSLSSRPLRLLLPIWDYNQTYMESGTQTLEGLHVVSSDSSNVQYTRWSNTAFDAKDNNTNLTLTFFTLYSKSFAQLQVNTSTPTAFHSFDSAPTALKYSFLATANSPWQQQQNLSVEICITTNEVFGVFDPTYRASSDIDFGHDRSYTFTRPENTWLTLKIPGIAIIDNSTTTTIMYHISTMPSHTKTGLEICIAWDFPPFSHSVLYDPDLSALISPEDSQSSDNSDGGSDDKMLAITIAVPVSVGVLCALTCCVIIAVVVFTTISKRNRKRARQQTLTQNSDLL
eukprot:TRINITY_DN4106_c0_g1_i1.p1 TRINITY_DN4106_c0_g1~~TRINITY_DN4106_c0_g1_i1.p1  ORF type:complete len:1084 (-),score=114.75 TRINITY_DN4106_c0_g1_i1:56-3307(-)